MNLPGWATSLSELSVAVDSEQLEDGCRLMYAGVLLSLTYGLADGTIPTSRLLLWYLAAFCFLLFSRLTFWVCKVFGTLRLNL